jgi:hypothetical protein
LLADPEANVFYAFIVSGRGKNGGKYAVMNDAREDVRGGGCDEIRGTEANLLAIVAQEPGVLDMYVNLVHILRMYDSSFINGCYVGVFLYSSKDNISLYTSHPKVWVK